MRRHIALLLGLVIAACSEQATAPSAPVASSMIIPSALRANLSSSASVWGRQITGEQAGALYAFFVPTNRRMAGQ